MVSLKVHVVGIVVVYLVVVVCGSGCGGGRGGDKGGGWSGSLIEKSYQNWHYIPVGFDWMVAFACLDLMQLLVIYVSLLFCGDVIGGFIGYGGNSILTYFMPNFTWLAVSIMIVVVMLVSLLVFGGIWGFQGGCCI